MSTPDTIGERIKYWRLRRNGMTQTALAGLAGVSQGYISRLESGKKSIDRRSTLVAIAAALRVTVADILGQPGDPTDPAKDSATGAIPAIWSALIEIEEGERRKPTISKKELDVRVGRAVMLRARSDYPAMAPLLPDLLTEAAAHGGLPLAKVGFSASVCLRNLGYRHLALPAARVALTAAQEAGDGGWIGAGHYIHTMSLPFEATRLTSRVALRALNQLQADAGKADVRQMLGQLHLSAALAFAVDNRFDDARAHLAEAEGQAETLGDPVDGMGFNLSCFGPTNVRLWKMNIAMEMGEFDRVLDLGRVARPDPLRVANRHQAYWMIVGKALAHNGRADHRALSAFMMAERAAPSSFPLNPLAHDAVASIARRATRQAISKDLRILARRLGIELGV